MSKETRKLNRLRKCDLNSWKVVDDRTGFVLNSKEAVIDHKGILTDKKNFDPIHPSEMYVEIKEQLPYQNPRPIGDDEGVDVE